MTVEAWLPWAIVGACAFLKLILALVNNTYGTAGQGRPGIARGPDNSEETETQPQLDREAQALVNLLRWTTLLAAAAALAVALEGSDLTVRGIAIAAAGSLAAAAAISSLAAALGSRLRRYLWAPLSPVATALRVATALPGVSAAAAVVTGRKPGNEDIDEEMSAALRESFDLLEAARIPEGEEELRRIRGVLRMDTVKVREIMRPRVDVLAAEANSKPEDVTEMMAVGGYSKIPVYQDSIDNVTGVIHARDLLRSREKEDGNSRLVQRLARPAMFVPESQNLESLLQEFQDKRTSIAIVVDEYGGVSGLVTVTDLIEEIVGELEDEFDVDEPELQRISESECLVDARASVDLLNEKLGARIEPQGFDTVGGLIYRELGKMPTSGDTIRVDGLEITVQSTIGRRIHRVRVRKLP